MSKKLLLALIFTVVFFGYWTAYSIEAYNLFHIYYSTAYLAYNMYYIIHFPNIVHGLQALVFTNHIAPDELLILPIYYLFQTPLTVSVFQVLLLSITGLSVFYVARGILKNETLALFMCFAFFINAGVMGMLLGGNTVEMFIPLFYILVFYYYMKKDKVLFYVSLVFLLAVQEASIYIACCMGVGLLIYEWFNRVDRKLDMERVKLATSILVFAIIALAIYNLIYYGLAGSYRAGAYNGLPPLMLAGAYPLVPLFGNAYPLVGTAAPTCCYAGTGGQENTISISHYSYSEIEDAVLLLILGILIAFLSFGISSLPELLILLIFLAAWIVQTFVLGHFSFLATYGHYYSLVVPATFSASILGMQKFEKENKILNHKLSQDNLLKINLVLVTLIFIVSLLTLPLIFNLFTGSQGFFYSTMLFSETPAETTAIAQLNSAISMVPKNASLLTQDFIFAHAMNREYVEPIAVQPNFFVPQYALFDLNSNITQITTGSWAYNAALPYFMSDVENYTQSRNYTLLYQNGTAMLYKRVS